MGTVTAVVVTVTAAVWTVTVVTAAEGNCDRLPRPSQVRSGRSASCRVSGQRRCLRRVWLRVGPGVDIDHRPAGSGAACDTFTWPRESLSPAGASGSAARHWTLCASQLPQAAHNSSQMLPGRRPYGDTYRAMRHKPHNIM